MSIGMRGVELPIVILCRIPGGTFESDYIVGDSLGNIGILSAECKRDAGIDLFHGGPKRLDIGEPYQAVSTPVISGHFTDDGDIFVETFEDVSVRLQRLLIDERYILKCAFSERLGTWFVGGDVRVHETSSA